MVKGGIPVDHHRYNDADRLPIRCISKTREDKTQISKIDYKL